MGIFFIKDLYNMNREFYIEYLGRNGIDIYNRIHGIDNRKVETERERKSVGKERTLKFDTDDKEELIQYLAFKRKHHIVNNKKGKGSYNRKDKHKKSY